MDLKSALNFGNPNEVGTQHQIIKFGDVARALPTTLRKKDPAADAYQLGTLESVGLPADGKAATIFRAYGRAGTATPGELAVQAYGATPGSGQIAVAPNGDIVVLAADAWTSMDVEYMPEKYDIVEAVCPVVAATGVCTLPAAMTTPGACILLEAEALTGTTIGKKIILVPATAAVATGRAAIKNTKDSVWFATADAVLTARIKMAVCPAVDLSALLAADTNAA